MSTVLVMMLVGMFALMGLSLPVSFSIGISAILALVIKGGIPLAMVPQKMFGAMNSFLMLSIPLYIVVGDLMVEGKISERLVKFANCLVGWMKGSMVYVTFTTAAFFGAISGSAAATTYAIGGMMYPEMVKVKYHPPFAAACSAACGTLGVLIPPSVPLLVFGAITGTSVASLFAYGAIGGIVVMICYMIGGRLELAYSRTEVSTTRVPSLREFWLAFKEAFPGLLAPAIILGGIYGGAFTATEAGVVAVVYVIFIGLFIYKDLTFEKIVRALVKSGISTACILLIVSCASVFSWLSTIEGLARIMADLVTRVGLSK